MGECPFTEHTAPNPEFHLLPRAKLPFISAGAQCNQEAESSLRKDLGVQPWSPQETAAVENTKALPLQNKTCERSSKNTYFALH